MKRAEELNIDLNEFSYEVWVRIRPFITSMIESASARNHYSEKSEKHQDYLRGGVDECVHEELVTRIQEVFGD